MTHPVAVLPDVSVLLLTYKHGAFIREAMESILSQTALPSELVVFDDASPDGTWDEIQSVVANYQGPVSILPTRQPVRRGGAGNRLDAWRAASGRLVVIAHGDDRSLPNRLERIHAVWSTTGASSITSDAFHLSDGIRIHRNVEQRRASGEISLAEICDTPFMPHLLGATMAFDRVVCERFPEAMPQGEVGAAPGDLLFPFRGALLGGHHYIDEPLIEWRRHPEQTTQRFFDSDSGLPLGRQESLEAFFVFGQLRRLSDLQHYASGPHDPARHRLALKRTLHTWLKRVGRWHAARNELESTGHKAVWL